MSKQTPLHSHDSLDAMRDQDRHSSGDTTSHAEETHNGSHMQEHTKPAGDLRTVVDKEGSQQNYRGEFNRGH